MIEFFEVSPAEDAAFLAAWAAESGGGALHRALRDDVQPRYASLGDGAPAGGVVLIAPGADLRGVFDGRQGFLGAWLVGDASVVHWSSPLMYARTGHRVARGALYAPV
jgi:hypothetical protein